MTGDERVRRGAVRALVSGLLAILTLAGAGGDACGQDVRVAIPPALTPGETYASQLVERLETEIAALARAERGGGDDERIVLRALVNVRIIAAELIGQGERAFEGGDVSILFGLRVAQGRHDLDALLTGRDAATDGDPAAAAAPAAATLPPPEVIELLHRFNNDALDLAETMRTVDPARLDPALAGIFAALGEAVTAMTGDAIVSHWPRRDAVEHGGSAAVSAAVAGAPALRQRLEGTVLAPETAAIVVAILDFLDRGARFPEYRAAIDRCCANLAGVLDCADAVAAAAWMSDETAAFFGARIHETVELLYDPETRAQGEAALRRHERTGRLFTALARLDALRAPTKPIEATLVHIVDAAGADPDGRVSEGGFDVVNVVVTNMIDYREIPEDDPPREHRATLQKLRRAYEAAEERVLEKLDQLALAADARANPALATILAGQTDACRDVGRVAAIPGLLAAIEAIHPPAVRGVSNQVKRLGQSLLDSNRRFDAARTLDDLRFEVAAFAVLPFERGLERGDRPAVVAAGGLHAELVEIIRSSRRAWAEACGRGDFTGEAAQRMEMLHRLTQMMAESAEVLRLEGDASVLNRWAAWEIPGGLLTRHVADLPNRLKLATAAVISDQYETLESQLDRTDREAPVAQLVGRFSLRLDPVLEPLPSGAAALLGQVLRPPSPDAWMVDQRERLAEFCRYAVEADFAWDQDREEDALRIQAFVHTLADELLRPLDRSSTGVAP